MTGAEFNGHYSADSFNVSSVMANIRPRASCCVVAVVAALLLWCSVGCLGAAIDDVSDCCRDHTTLMIVTAS